MAVPKKKTSKAKRDMRRSHHFLTPSFSIVCPQCGERVLRHRMCTSCGTYRGKKITEVAQQA